MSGNGDGRTAERGMCYDLTRCEQLRKSQKGQSNGKESRSTALIRHCADAKCDESHGNGKAWMRDENQGYGTDCIDKRCVGSASRREAVKSRGKVSRELNSQGNAKTCVAQKWIGIVELGTPGNGTAQLWQHSCETAWKAWPGKRLDQMRWALRGNGMDARRMAGEWKRKEPGCNGIEAPPLDKLRRRMAHR